MNALPACLSVYHVCAWILQRSEEDFRSPETGVMVGCEPRSSARAGVLKL